MGSGVAGTPSRFYSSWTTCTRRRIPMAKATTKTTAAPRRGGKAKAADDAAALAITDAKIARGEEVPQFSIALSAPGEDIPAGARRLSCPDCGAKHDVVRNDVAPGQGGTWSVPDFKCLAPCGYQAASQPVN